MAFGIQNGFLFILMIWMLWFTFWNNNIHSRSCLSFCFIIVALTWPNVFLSQKGSTQSCWILSNPLPSFATKQVLQYHIQIKKGMFVAWPHIVHCLHLTRIFLLGSIKFSFYLFCESCEYVSKETSSLDANSRVFFFFYKHNWSLQGEVKSFIHARERRIEWLSHSDIWQTIYEHIDEVRGPTPWYEGGEGVWICVNQWFQGLQDKCLPAIFFHKQPTNRFAQDVPYYKWGISSIEPSGGPSFVVSSIYFGYIDSSGYGGYQHVSW